jgi:hypothetical protein
MLFLSKRPRHSPFNAIVLIALLIMLGGCVATFEHPLTDPGAHPQDKTLLGTWIGANGDETMFVHIGKDEDTHMLLIVLTEMKDNGEIDHSSLSGHTSILPSGRYLNLKWILPPKNKTKGYMLIKYAVKDGNLHLYATDDTVIETDIEKGVLKGEILKTKTAYVTEDTKHLVQYVNKNDGRIFPEDHLLMSGLRPFKKR